MYDYVPDCYPTEPECSSPIGYCTECGKEIYSGDWIYNIRGERYCEDCIDSFHTEAESEEYFDDVI